MIIAPNVVVTALLQTASPTLKAGFPIPETSGW